MHGSVLLAVEFGGDAVVGDGCANVIFGVVMGRIKLVAILRSQWWCRRCIMMIRRWTVWQWHRFGSNDG